MTTATLNNKIDNVLRAGANVALMIAVANSLDEDTSNDASVVDGIKAALNVYNAELADARACYDANPPAIPSRLFGRASSALSESIVNVAHAVVDFLNNEEGAEFPGDGVEWAESNYARYLA